MFQQGDVLIKQPGETVRGGLATFDGIPAEAKRIRLRPLAQGEATGHAHRVQGDAELYKLGQRLFLRVLAGNVRVVHEEHHQVEIPPGDYEVEQVREYDPFAHDARTVWD